MFIRAATVKGKKYYRLVESYRENGKVKQRYIASLFTEDMLELNSPEVMAEMVAGILKDDTGFADDLIGDKKSLSQQVMDKARELIRDAK